MGMLQPRHIVAMEVERDRDRAIDPLLPAALPTIPGELPIPVATVEEEGLDPLAPREDALGRLVANLLHAMVPGRFNEVQSPRVTGIIRRIRRRLLLIICCTVLAAPIAVWLLVWGVSTYLDTGQPECRGSLRIWLQGFLLLQLAWPICMPSLTLLLLGWCAGGLLLLQQSPHCPKLESFLVGAVALQTVQAVLLVAAALAALTARPLLLQLAQLLAQNGTDPEVISAIATLLPSEVSVEEECVICLSRDDEDGVPWRELLCAHRFHEPCLLEWLMKAKRCPVCRLDLHSAYQLDHRSELAEGP